MPSVTFPPVVPPPESEPITVSKFVMSRFTPATLARVTAEVVPKAERLPALSVPVFTTVGPV